MPFDAATAIAVRTRPELRPVAIWLFILAGMVLVMVTLGGATRLSGSGLSIMEWAPLMGTLPPLSEAEWARLYKLYQQIPQYELVNRGFGLEGFKSIFWLEWGHRLWGRLMGLALALPLLWFAVRGRLGRGLVLRLVAILALGGAQGAIGWFMVASGFEADRTTVSPYRLVLHLGMAVALYSLLLWTALGLWRQAVGPRPAVATRLVRRMTALCCAAIALTMLAGGFVAGLRAGLTYNSFPFMDGQLVPISYGALRPVHLNLFENVAAVQFNHRLLATLTALLCLGTAALGWRRSAGAARSALVTLGLATAAQYALGVLTLIWAVPLGLGTAHQAMAMVVLTAAMLALHAQRRHPIGPTPA